MINKDYAFYTENFEIYQFHFKTYGHGVWFNPEKETYDEATERAKNIMYAKVQKDNPHLIMLGEKSKPKRIVDIEEPNKEVTITMRKPKTQAEIMIEQIETVTDIKVLDTYKFLAKKYPSIQNALDKKLKELTA